MGSSLVLTGGAATAKTLKESISLASHGFTVGDVIRWNNGSPSYIRAQADSAANAEVLGIVSAKVDTNTFELTYGGYIDLPQFAGISYPVLFLSGVCAGGLTHNPPSALGTVIKPVATKHPTLNGFVLNNYLGTQIGGSSTVGIDQVQPVGSIMPFAGSAIPDSWLECNGTTYSVSEYPELYGAIRYTTGDRMPLYGYVAKITSGVGNWTGIAAVGGYIQFKNNTTSIWTTNQPATGQNLIYDTQPEITAQVIAVSGADVWVQVLPVYTSSTKTFVYPNVAFTTGGVLWNDAGAFTTSKYRVLNASGTIIHTNNNVSAVSLVAFNTPDMRGRFALGINTSALGEAETDTANTSAISGIYSLGSEGGEERHTLTIAEMPGHTHGAPTSNGSAGSVYEVALTAFAGYDYIAAAPTASTGGDTPHNNMPPYLAVRYIIKAKPYTRAAIIDGVDLPYSNLLVRSTDSNSLRSELLSGASGGDLVFYTNSGEASKTGTERMRLTNRNGLRLTQQDGYTFGINIIGSGTNPGSTTVSSVAPFLKFYNPETPINPYTWWCPRDGIALSVESHSTNEGAIIDQYSTGGIGTPLFTVTSVGNVGIGNSSPGATLDVNGTVRIRGGGLPGMSLGDRLVAADTSGTLKWDTALIKAQDNVPLQIAFNGTVGTGTGWTDSLAGTTVITGDMSARTDVYTSTTATLKRGVWLVQPYNNLTYSSFFRASVAYYGRVGVQAVSGTLSASFPGININFNYDSSGAKFNISTYGYTPDPYEMVPFMVYVTSDTATVKGIVKHMDGGTISVVNGANLGMGFNFYRIS